VSWAAARGLIRRLRQLVDLHRAHRTTAPIALRLQPLLGRSSRWDLMQQEPWCFYSVAVLSLQGKMYPAPSKALNWCVCHTNRGFRRAVRVGGSVHEFPVMPRYGRECIFASFPCAHGQALPGRIGCRRRRDACRSRRCASKGDMSRACRYRRILEVF
jgi:hypothetical protein